MMQKQLNTIDEKARKNFIKIFFVISYLKRSPFTLRETLGEQEDGPAGNFLEAINKKIKEKNPNSREFMNTHVFNFLYEEATKANFRRTTDEDHLPFATRVVNSLSADQLNDWLIRLRNQFVGEELSEEFDYAFRKLTNSEWPSERYLITNFFFGDTKKQSLSLLGLEALLIGATELAAYLDHSGNSAAYALSSLKQDSSFADMLKRPAFTFIGVLVIFLIWKACQASRNKSQSPSPSEVKTESSTNRQLI